MCDLNPGIVGALVQSVVFPLPQEAFEAGWDETNMYPTDREFWLRCLAYVSVQVGVAASVMGLAFSPHLRKSQLRLRTRIPQRRPPCKKARAQASVAAS